MTRFMMTLAESVDLVEHAFANGQPGDLFIRKAPAATIETLVEALGDLFGIHPTTQTIGVRHGEKLHETLATSAELARSTENTEYFRIGLDARGLTTACTSMRASLGHELRPDYDSATADLLDVERLKALLVTVPEIVNELALAGRKSSGGRRPDQLGTLMKIVVTGADGFLARHLLVRLRAFAPDETVVRIGREALNDEAVIDRAVTGADAVVHLAGVNRGTAAEVEEGNVSVAEQLVAGLDRVGGSPRLIFGNSRQAGDATPYGQGKARASQILADWAERAGSPYARRDASQPLRRRRQAGLQLRCRHLLPSTGDWEHRTEDLSRPGAGSTACSGRRRGTHGASGSRLSPTASFDRRVPRSG